MREDVPTRPLRQGDKQWQVRIFIVIIIFMGVCTCLQLLEERSLFSIHDRLSIKSFLKSSSSHFESNSTSLSFTNALSWSSVSSAVSSSSISSSSSSTADTTTERLYAPILHHEYYSILQPLAKSRATSASATAALVADDLSRLQSAAKTFLVERQLAYQQANSLQTFKLRGVGYLYTVHKIILVARVPDNPQLFQNNTIRIDNVYDGPILDGENNNITNNSHDIDGQTKTTTIRKDCHLFTIWVRVMGPELFAGTAQAIQPENPNQSCYWEFSFYLQVPGLYETHAKSLLFDGYADRHIETVGSGRTQITIQCPGVQRADLRTQDNGKTFLNITQQFPLHAGIQGFKLYDAPGSCCEVCSRMPDCQYWATPAFGIPAPCNPTNGCELFFQQSALNKNVVPVSVRIPDMIANFKQQEPKEQQRQIEAGRKQITAYHGARHNYPTAYFVGCHWSFWFSLEFGCLSGELDDQVFMLLNTFSAVNNNNNDMAIETTIKSEEKAHALANMNREVDMSLPLCELSNMTFHQNGGRWVRQDWPNKTICPFPMEHVMINKHFPLTAHRGEHPRCWHRDNLNILKTKCFEMNCKFIRDESYWRGPLQEEKEWFGVWRYNDCNLLEFTDHQIQKCVKRHKISGFVKHGASISGYISDYMNHRLKNITLIDVKMTNKPTVQVHYDTVSAPHIAWREDEDAWRRRLEEMQPLSTFHYIVLPFYWASERETYVHAMNAEKMAVLFEQVLAPKGFRIINAFDFTKVFPYDTATQSDGLHIIGPPLKMLTTILFHDLCKDVVGGRGAFV